MIVLKNINGGTTVSTIFRGRKITVKPRHSLVLKSDEEGKAEAQYLTSTYGFVVDITKLVVGEKGQNENISAKK
jgi:hypothetical protein